MSAPDLGRSEIEAVAQALRSGRLSQGPFLEQFETRLSQFLGGSVATAVSSGTAALCLALRAAGVGAGDWVVTTPFSFVATANAVVLLGARPFFVDVDPLTGNIDPVRIEAALEARNKPLKAVLPVHVFGQPADMAAILRSARRRGLPVVEDACEALGAEYQGRKAGTLGDAAAFGFYPNKQITTGEGGAVVTNREDWSEKFRSWRNQGRVRSKGDGIFDQIGHNYRLDEMSAALGAAQMARIEEILRKRDQVARWYIARLSAVEGIELPFTAPSTTRMSWFVFVVRAASRAARDAIQRFLRAGGVPSRIYFRPIHLQPSFRDLLGLRRGAFPGAERWGDVSLALPFSGVMTADQVDWVGGLLEKAVASLRGPRLTRPPTV